MHRQHASAGRVTHWRPVTRQSLCATTCTEHVCVGPWKPGPHSYSSPPRVSRTDPVLRVQGTGAGRDADAEQLRAAAQDVAERARAAQRAVEQQAAEYSEARRAAAGAAAQAAALRCSPSWDLGVPQGARRAGAHRHSADEHARRLHLDAGGQSATGRAVCSVAYTPPACRGESMPVSPATRLMQHSNMSYLGLCAPLQARAGQADSRPRCRRGRRARPA